MCLKLKKFWIPGIMVLSLIIVMVPSVWAASTAQGVALTAGAGCSDASLDITLTTVGATREYGLATNAAGAVLDEFEQSTGLGNFDGTFVDYGIFFSSAQPDGTVIGSYAYVGETPPSAADTGEFFVLYECSSSGANTILFTCTGAYGSCPQTAQQGLVAAAPGCDVLINISATAVVGSFVADAPVYWAPGSLVSPVITIPAGKTAWVMGLDASGAYRKILWSCDFLWVPVATMGPNYDDVWNGRPLPTDVVD